MTGSESPAAVLRRAAELMRERAEPLPPSPWRPEGRDVTATQDYQDDGSWDWGRGYVAAACPRQDEAEHVASWGPLAALAVAEGLESAAERAERPVALKLTSLIPGPLAVACAYLGEAS